MPGPSINQLPVQDPCFFDTLVASFVVFARVKLFSAIRRCFQVDDNFVPSVSQLDCTPASFVEKCLPDLICDVSLTIHDTPVADENGLLVSMQRSLEKDVFEDHLCLHEIDLELDTISEGHLAGLNEASPLHHQRGSLWNEKNFESLLGKLFVKGEQCSRLAGARSARETNARDLVL